ncbi:MAG TPA: aminotransferase class III-fold pyridoxal phosphate-dependent enzyme, partial [Solirubrobacterales bacterium]|nr:aminotransferase class III-fold pyridoxal phosphate-dependent enzyme [Solirubrobacterales bacterium]
IDETHTFSAGPGGCTAAWALEPDMLTIGKAIGSGVPAGAIGLSARIAADALARERADYEDTGGVGGTLAGNALSLAAVRATLERVLTEEAFARTIPLATRFTEGLQGIFERRSVPWNVTQLGCRAEYRFEPEPARNGSDAHAAAEPELERYLHLHALNRGLLLTPFHNMALISPETSEADVDLHTELFDTGVAELIGTP